MALYRHNSTGFLGEFATNPGAGYTAVSAMPTDNVANRVAWWRGLDTHGQTSSWHPSLYRLPEDPREARLSLEFSQEFALISADGDGVVTSPRDPANTYYLGAATEVRVFRGLSNVTVSEGWAFQIVEDGCTALLTEVEGLHTVAISSIPDAETKVGYVRVRAFRTEDGLPPEDDLGVLIKDFRFIKVLQGNDGTNGTDGPYVSYVFKASATAPTAPTGTAPIPTGWLDSPPVSSDPVWMSKATVTAGAAGTWSTPVKVTATDGADGSDGSFTTYQYAKNSSFTTAPTTGWGDTPYALSAGEYQWMRTKTTDPNTGGVTYGSAYRVTGEKGADGANGSSGTVIDLSNEAHTVPTDADGNNGVYTGATTTASLYVGGTDDSANWTWTATPSSGVTGTATNSNRTFTVSAMSVDVGTVTFTATKTGQSQRTAVFTISKAKGGVAYSLDVSAGSVSKSKAGVYNPTSLTLTASKITTSGVTTYAGRFRIQTQATLGGVWTTVYSSASDETTTSYNVPANIVAIKAMLYLAGGFTTVLDQESVPVVFDGQDGSSGIILDLDNENQTVAAQKDGTWISGTTATTTARLYLGATQLTSGITWSVQSATAGITYSPTNNTSSYTVSVTGMTAALATGTITIAAVYNGVTYTQVFTISKANAGSDGTPATVYWLSTSASAIAKSAAGVYNPTSFTVNAYSQTGTNAQAAYTGRFQIQTQATLNGAWTTRYTSLGNESSTTYSVPASIVAIRVYLYQAGGFTTLLDQETLPVVSDGQTGLAYTVVLTNEASIVPFTGGVGSYTDTPTTVLVYSGATQLGTVSASEWFQISSVTGVGITPGAISGANIGAASNMTAATATITITVAIKNSNGATKATVTKLQTLVKAEKGVFLKAESTTYVMKFSADYATISPPTATVTVTSANLTGTPTWEFRRDLNGSLNAWSAVTIWNGLTTVSLDYSGQDATWRAGIRYVQYRVTLGGYTDTVTVAFVKDGQQGNPGERGSRQIVITGTSNWSDQAAWQGITTRFGGTAPVLSDLVTIVNTSNSTSTSKFYAGGGNGTTTWGTWTVVTEYINGNLLVTGTVGANAIAANAITAGKIAAGSITADRLTAGTITSDSAAIASLSATKITAGTLDASKVTVRNLNADTISANAITTEKINGSAVTTDKIGASAVTKTYAGSNIVTNSVTKGAAIQIFSQPITSSSGELGPVLLSISVSAVNPNRERYFYIKCIIQSNDGFSFYQEGSVPPGANAYALTVPMTIVQNPNGQSTRTYTFYVQFEDGVSGAMSLTRAYSAAALLLQR